MRHRAQHSPGRHGVEGAALPRCVAGTTAAVGDDVVCMYVRIACVGIFVFAVSDEFGEGAATLVDAKKDLAIKTGMMVIIAIAVMVVVDRMNRVCVCVVPALTRVHVYTCMSV